MSTTENEVLQIRDSVRLVDRDLNSLTDEQSRYYKWITDAQNAFNLAWPSMQKDRDYVEHDQDPSYVPDDKQYIKENKITDLVRRLVGGMIGGEVKPGVAGGGKMKEPFMQLFEEILEQTRFREYVVETVVDGFYVEGYSGIKYVYNPHKASVFGLGSPEIIPLQAHELWLDPASRDGRHNDDRYRVFYTRKSLDYCLKKWPGKESEIRATSDEFLAENASTQYMCDIYEIEFIEYEFTRAKIINGVIKEVEGNTPESFIKEEQVHKVATVINKTAIVESAKETNYDGWKLIPFLHTPRKDIHGKKGRYPFGVVRLLVENQDLLNVINSILGEIVKADIRNMTVISGPGVTPEVESKFRTEATKSHGVLAIQSDGVRVDNIPKTGLAPAILQFREIIKYSFDEQTGKFSPDRGEISGSSALSGVAIGRLQSRGSLPEFVAQMHLEDPFTQLARCIFYSVKNEINTPFKLTRDIDGRDVDIYFNTPQENVPRKDMDNGYNIAEGGYVNRMDSLDLKVFIEVYMNLAEKKNEDLQKAAFARTNGALSLEDFMKELYPRTWKDKLENLQREQQALALVSKVQQMAPEQVGQLNQMADGLIQTIQNAQNLDLPGEGQSMPGGPVSL